MTTPPNDDATPQPCDPLDPAVLAALGLPSTPRSRPTGPKTVAGKAKSRANAVKHGLRCQVVEPPDQRAKIAERVAEWTDAMKPADPLQRWLVARAATASVRLDRCVERENLALEAEHRPGRTRLVPTPAGLGPSHRRPARRPA